MGDTRSQAATTRCGVAATLALCCALGCGGSTPPPEDEPSTGCPTLAQYQDLVVEFFLKGLTEERPTPQVTPEAEHTLRLMAANGYEKLKTAEACERAIAALQDIQMAAIATVEGGTTVPGSGPASMCPLWPLCD